MSITNEDQRKTAYFTCRMPLSMKDKVNNRAADLGLSSVAEYIRYLIITDLEKSGDIFGQMSDVQ